MSFSLGISCDAFHATEVGFLAALHHPILLQRNNARMRDRVTAGISFQNSSNVRDKILKSFHKIGQSTESWFKTRGLTGNHVCLKSKDQHYDSGLSAG
jgi:hypothetical protein